MNARQVRNTFDVVLSFVVIYVGTSFLAAWTRGHGWLGVLLTATFVIYVITFVSRRVDRRNAASRDGDGAA